MTTMITGVLGELRTTVCRRLSQGGTAPVPHDGTRLDLARTFVREVSACLEELPRAATADVATLVNESTIQAAFPAFLSYRSGYGDRAADLLCRIWINTAAALGALDAEEFSPLPPIEPPTPTPEDREYLAVFNIAVSEWLRKVRAGDEARLILRRLMTSLDLSADEVGRMFRVTRETVRRWELGMVAVPTARLVELTSVDGALDRLLSLFLPERLPAVIRRRPTPLFDGESALDWILRGRIREVADRYDRLLSYQPDAIDQYARQSQ